MTVKHILRDLRGKRRICSLDVVILRRLFKTLKTNENFEQMVLLTEFKAKVRSDIRSHLDEQKVEEPEKAEIMADDYALTHKKVLWFRL